jgi:hypothetical protein
VVPEGPPVDPKADDLVNDFLESDTVMDPYLSKAVPEGRPVSDEALRKKLEEVFSGAGGNQSILRPPPKVNKMGTFASNLEKDLELAARTEGLDLRQSFGKGVRKPTAKKKAPRSQRSVQDILSELEALDD